MSNDRAWSRWLGLLVTIISLGGCKPTAGEVCRCGSDCADGLVCAYNGTILAPDECRPPQEVGECVDDESLPSGEDGLDPMQPHMDMLTKLDLGGGADTTGSDTTGSDTTGADTTGADTTGSDTTGSDTTGSDTTDSTSTTGG